jgi:predicted neuraminidase
MMRKSQLLFLAVVTTAASLGAYKQQQGSPKNRTFQAAGKNPATAYMDRLYPSAHAANLLLLHNGDVLCFWFSGTAEGESDVAILMARLPRGAGTWSQPKLIDRRAGESFQNPVGFQDNTGRIWLFHTAQAAGQGQAHARVMELLSSDGGGTWSEPRVVFAEPGSFTRQPMVVTDDGSWLLPMFFTPSGDIVAGAESNYSVVMLSRDQGKAWRECRIPGSEGLVHPDILKLRRDQYILFLRSRYADFIYESGSADGCAWSRPTPTALPNNNASIQAIRLANGHLVMAFNNSSAGGKSRKPGTANRFPLSVALSVDEGNTWCWVHDLEGGDKRSSKRESRGVGGTDEFSYPSILQLPSGSIMVAYTYRRLTIKIARFDEAWIKRNSTIGSYRGSCVGQS